MKILIVDDARTIRTATSIAIRTEGHSADAADSGPDALLKLKEDSYDMVLLDLRLSDEDGLDVLAEMKRLHPGLAVVVFSAYASANTATAALEAGAFDYLTKPFTPEQLRHCMDRVRKFTSMERRIRSLEDQLDASSPRVGEMISLDEIEREHIARVLAAADSQEDAARILGIDPATLYRKRKKWEAEASATRNHA